jgi:hypothetical protein
MRPQSLCSRCKECPPRKGFWLCSPCEAIYRREYRARKREERERVARPVAGKVEIGRGYNWEVGW